MADFTLVYLIELLQSQSAFVHFFRFLEDFLATFVGSGLLFILLILSYEFESLEAYQIQHYLIEVYDPICFVKLDHNEALELLSSSDVWALED